MIYSTHRGVFHCDEVTGLAIVKLAGICSNLDFHRGDELVENAIIADKGRIYNPQEGRFDHHQLNLRNPQPELLRPNGITYATAGLLWAKYGEVICGSKEVAERVDITLIQGIDANDAAPDFDLTATAMGSDVRIQTLPTIISSYNAKDPNDDGEQSERFYQAALLMEAIINNAISSAERFIEAQREFDLSITEIRDSKIIVLEKFLPWQEIIENKYPDALMIIYPSSRGGYSLQMIPSSPGKRTFKHTNGIERPIWFSGFIHAAKFIAGCDSKAEAIMLAEYNLR